MIVGYRLLLVINDVEDIFPHPLQLKKAVLTFCESCTRRDPCVHDL